MTGLVGSTVGAIQSSSISKVGRNESARGPLPTRAPAYRVKRRIDDRFLYKSLSSTGIRASQAAGPTGGGASQRLFLTNCRSRLRVGQIRGRPESGDARRWLRRTSPGM